MVVGARLLCTSDRSSSLATHDLWLSGTAEAAAAAVVEGVETRLIGRDSRENLMLPWLRNSGKGHARMRCALTGRTMQNGRQGSMLDWQSSVTTVMPRLA